MSKSSAWKGHERGIRDAFIKAGLPATRISRAGDWSQKTFDVQIDGHPRFKIDGKYSIKGFRSSRMFTEVSEKYCTAPGDEAIVVFKGYRQVGSHAMVRTEFLAELLAHYLSNPPYKLNDRAVKALKKNKEAWEKPGFNKDSISYGGSG